MTAYVDSPAEERVRRLVALFPKMLEHYSLEEIAVRELEFFRDIESLLLRMRGEATP